MPVQTRSGKSPTKKISMSADVGEKREEDDPPKPDTRTLPEKKLKIEEEDVAKYLFHPGVIERGHIYFFYRPKVQHEHVESLDDVKNLHMLLVPRPPEFSVHTDQSASTSREGEMTVLKEGADVIPAAETLDRPKKHYRLLTIGKKRLPEAEGSHDVFWATVTAVGDDLHTLERGFGEKTYETQTRGVRHEGTVRLAGRGVYAIANREGRVRSSRVTHLAYHLSHPSSPGAVQEGLGIHTAASYVVQVKNPLGEDSKYGPRIGRAVGKRAQYPDGVMERVFERGSEGRHEYGLRFVPCGWVELLEYEGAELLMIGARSGASGSDTTLGERRGEALKEAGERESSEGVEEIFRELAADKEAFPAEGLAGEWI